MKWEEQWCNFDGAAFSEFTQELETPTDGDWSEAVRTVGWTKRTGICPSEFSPFNFETYEFAGKWLVSINDSCGGMGTVRCASFVAFLRFMVQYVCPIAQLGCSVNQDDAIQQVMGGILDPHEGLDPVVEVYQRQSARRAREKRERAGRPS